ncbi:hypothetical protein KP803_00545 [Vibrio sp. ZSDE26]|uniref:Uncharacterized protein n=1 Tax=Vibrio amylolyticus TaxID=2847292 RepID=A0A9X2BGC9_9VIBR|nr:hypothetical protein [Vibrio amylolyticus]MCK6261755.1 hypothetical protein [Vibrio amylolyticus]
MYFWNIKALKKDIIGEKLTEKDRFIYAFIQFSVYTIAFEYLLSGHVEHSNDWNQFEAMANIAIVLIGTYLIYKANGGENGQDFLGRYFSIGFVVTIRFSVLLIPMVVLLTVYDIEFRSESDILTTSPLEVFMYILWTIFLYANIAKHMRLKD